MNLSAWRRFLRFGFRLLYNEMAWTYDAVSWLVSRGEWRAWQQATLPYVVGERVLELGHGPGHMLLALQQAGYTVVGLDLSLHMGRMARKRIARRRVASISLTQGVVQQLPFATAVFDTVVATFPTEYVVDPRTVAAAYRVLAENGRFVIVPEGHLTTSGPVTRFIDWLYAITGQNSGTWAMDGSEAELWRPLRQRFSEAGFAVSVETVTFPRSQATVIICQKG